MKGKWRDILHSHLFLHPPSIYYDDALSYYFLFFSQMHTLSRHHHRRSADLQNIGTRRRRRGPPPTPSSGKARVGPNSETAGDEGPPSSSFPLLNVVGLIPRPGPGAILFCPRFQKPSLQTEGVGGAIKPQTRDSPSPLKKSAIPRVSRKSTIIFFFGT